MIHLLVKNEVEDVDRWLAVFRTEDAATAECGLHLEHLWRDADDPRVVWFLMRCESRERAEAFMARPESAEVGQRAGVTGGAVVFLDALSAEARGLR